MFTLASKARDRGFTLIELLVVILILGILAAIALPNFLGQTTRANDRAAQVTLSNSYRTAKAYYIGSDRSFPVNGSRVDGALGEFSYDQGQYRFMPFTGPGAPAQVSTGYTPTAKLLAPGSLGSLADVSQNDVTVYFDNEHQVTLCTRSESETVFCLRDNERGELVISASGGSRLLSVAQAATRGNLSYTKADNEEDARASLATASEPAQPVGTATVGWGNQAVTPTTPGGGEETPTVNPPTSSGDAPSVTGGFLVGQILSVDNGAWGGTSPFTYTYQWQRCDAAGENCVDVSGETQFTYQLTGADTGKRLRAVVTAINSAGSASRSSTLSGETVNPLPPSNTDAPTLTGGISMGNTISVSNGTWTQSPTGYAYQWQRCDLAGNNCADISGETSNTHTINGGDFNKRLRAVVTASNTFGSASTPSAAAAALTTAGVIKADNPTGYWRMDEGSGNTVSNEVNGSQAMTLDTQCSPNGASSCNVEGAFGPGSNAIRFTNTRAQVTNPPGTNGQNVPNGTGVGVAVTGDFTLEAWIKPTAASGNLIEKYNGCQNGFALRTNGANQIQMITMDSITCGSTFSGGTVADNNRWTLNQWNHVVFTLSSNGVGQFYINGKASGSASTNNRMPTITPNSMKINGVGDTTSTSGDTSYDEIAIYDHALTPAQILAHYQAH